MTGRKIPMRNAKGQVTGYLTILHGSEIPALFLEVDADELKKVYYNKNHEITEGRAAYMEADGTVTYSGALEQMKGRGNNTFRYSKKPYQLKLGGKVSLSGMGKGKTWLLLANWNDVSLLRNQIMLDMSREIGLRNAVECIPADVWINGSYNGLYLLTEKIQIGKGRIDITNLEKETEKVNSTPFDPGKLETDKKKFPLLRSYPAVRDPEDITGGYILTIEKKSRLKNYYIAGFRTEEDLTVRIIEPTYPSRAQAEYIYGRINEMHKALVAQDGINPETGKSFEEYLDIVSFSQRLLLDDWCKNYDYHGGSQYMYKDSDKADPLVYAGPAWDYDLCFGDMADRGYYPEGPYVTTSHKNYNLWWILYKHEAIRTKAGEIWKNDFRPAVAVLLGEDEAREDGIIRSIDEYRDAIAASAEMNYRRWYVSTSASGGGSGGSFDNAVKYLKKWITTRTAWMDGQYMPEETAAE